MAAAAFALALEAGATYKLALTVRTGTAPDAPPMDLTGWEPRLQLRPAADSLDVLIDCRPANGRLTVTNAAGGAIALTLSALDTARFDFDAAVYDLIISNGTEVRRLLQGAATVSRAVTR